MQSDASIIHATTSNKKIVNELLGGLSIAPYGIHLLLSAYAFSQGWLNWETNGGPPYLGFVLAWLLDKLIRVYYRKRFNFVFNIYKPKSERSYHPNSRLLVLMIVGFLVAWFVDANFHYQIRFMPLLFGILVCLRAVAWLQKSWIGYGFAHFILGFIPISMSILPFILSISSNNQYFGFQGIYELSTIGIMIIGVSFIEHLIFVREQHSTFL